MSKFRGDYVPEVAAFGESMGELLVTVFQKIGHANIMQSCATCKYWSEDAAAGVVNGCSLFKQMPPVQVIVNGCNEYQDICQIPF